MEKLSLRCGLADAYVGYTGHKFDADLNLNYMQARYYDPEIGRFYGNDPVDAATFINEGSIQDFGGNAGTTTINHQQILLLNIKDRQTVIIKILGPIYQQIYS